MPYSPSSSRGAASGGGLSAIQTITVGAGGQAALDFTGIPATFTHLQIRLKGIANTNTTGVKQAQLRINNDSTSNNYWYTYNEIANNVINGPHSQNLPTMPIVEKGAANTTIPTTFIIDIPFYLDTTYFRTGFVTYEYFFPTISAAQSPSGVGAWIYLSQTVVSRVTLDLTGVASAFDQNSFAILYGI